MSYDLEHKMIYSRHDDTVRVQNVSVVGARDTTIYAEENGDFIVTINVKKCALEPQRMHIVTVTKEMLAAMNAAQQ